MLAGAGAGPHELRKIPRAMPAPRSQQPLACREALWVEDTERTLQHQDMTFSQIFQLAARQASPLPNREGKPVGEVDETSGRLVTSARWLPTVVG